MAFKVRQASVGQILPEADIKVAFTTKARAAIQKGQRGIVVAVLEDATKDTVWTTLKSVSDISAEDWTAENVALLNSIYEVFPPNRVLVRRRTTGEDVAVIQKELEHLNFTQVAFAEITTEDDLKMVTWAKTRVDKKGEVYVSATASNSDATTIVELFKHNMIKHRVIENYTLQHFTLMLAGAMAGCPLNQSLDNIILPNIVDVDVVEPVLGKLSLKKDDELVRINLAINSKTTFTETFAPSTRFIKIWDGMCTIKNDIEKTFRDFYLGKYLNNYDNKMAFVNDIKNVYFKEMTPNVLAIDYDNTCDIDVEANERYIVTMGKDPATMTETEIRTYPTGESVFLTADVVFQNVVINLKSTCSYE